MKRVFFFLLILFKLSFAMDLADPQFLKNLFLAIFQKKFIKVYVADPSFEKIFHDARFLIVKNCKESDLVFGGSVCRGKYHFVLDYQAFQKDPYSFGAFYWRKGRPQLIFKQVVLKKINPKAIKWLKRYLDQ